MLESRIHMIGGMKNIYKLYLYITTLQILARSGPRMFVRHFVLPGLLNEIHTLNIHHRLRGGLSITNFYHSPPEFVPHDLALAPLFKSGSLGHFCDCGTHHGLTYQ